jgi:hypothetical protein
VLRALATKSEEEGETEYHDLSDDDKHEGCVIPLAAQVGGIDKRTESPRKKEDEEE